MKTPAKCLRAILTAVFAVALAQQVPAQSPGPLAGKVLTVVVPFAAGGNVDIGARLIAPRLAEQLQATVVIENKVGASGTLGAYAVARAKPDGTTLLFTPVSPISVVPLVSPSIMRYDAQKDFAVVGAVSSTPFVLVARPDFPASTLHDFVQVVRQRPGKFTFGTDGTGSGLHLTAEVIKQSAGLDLLHVPYKSGVQVMAELAGGHIDVAVLPVPLAQAFIQGEKIKAIGVTSAQPWPTLPKVPPLSSAPEFGAVVSESWQALFAPAGLAPAILDSLRHALAAVMADPELSPAMMASGFAPMLMDANGFASYVANERATLARAVVAAGIKPE